MKLHRLRTVALAIALILFLNGCEEDCEPRTATCSPGNSFCTTNDGTLFPNDFPDENDPTAPWPIFQPPPLLTDQIADILRGACPSCEFNFNDWTIRIDGISHSIGCSFQDRSPSGGFSLNCNVNFIQPSIHDLSFNFDCIGSLPTLSIDYACQGGVQCLNGSIMGIFGAYICNPNDPNDRGGVWVNANQNECEAKTGIIWTH